jgi:hypothetical protein
MTRPRSINKALSSQIKPIGDRMNERRCTGKQVSCPWETQRAFSRMRMMWSINAARMLRMSLRCGGKLTDVLQVCGELCRLMTVL